jgi:hypothetical protein
MEIEGNRNTVQIFIRQQMRASTQVASKQKKMRNLERKRNLRR